jgi:hypothetical protein
VQALWRRHAGTLVGIATGKASGLAALDIDAKHAAAVSDLEGGKQVTHTISHLLEDVVKFDREMDIPCFTNTGKQLQVNVTNGEWLLDNFGDDPNDWGGHRVTLYLAPYQLKGKETKLGIRLKRADGSASTGGPPPKPPPPKDDLDDDIPY